MGENSLKKLGSVILPFLVYFAVHDLASVLLAFLMGLGLGKFGDGCREYMAVHAGSVNGVLNGLALCIGALAVWPMANKELGIGKGRKASVLHQAARVQAGTGRESARDETGRGLGHASLASADQSVEEKGFGGKVLEYFVMILCAAVLAIGMNILLVLTGITGMSENYADISAKQYGVGMGLGLILYGAVSPLAEEIVFRGLIYNRMKRYLKTRQAILLCGMLFGVYHGNLVQGIYGCVMGVVITLVYEWYGDIWVPVLFHGAANVSVFLISYDAERFQGIVKPFYCVLFMGLSICGGFLMRKWNSPGSRDGSGTGIETA